MLMVDGEQPFNAELANPKLRDATEPVRLGQRSMKIGGLSEEIVAREVAIVTVRELRVVLGARTARRPRRRGTIEMHDVTFPRCW
jgi:hypothetical protein